MKSPYDLTEREFKFLQQEAEDKYDIQNIKLYPSSIADCNI